MEFESTLQKVFFAWATNTIITHAEEILVSSSKNMQLQSLDIIFATIDSNSTVLVKQRYLAKYGYKHQVRCAMPDVTLPVSQRREQKDRTEIYFVEATKPFSERPTNKYYLIDIYTGKFLEQARSTPYSFPNAPTENARREEAIIKIRQSIKREKDEKTKSRIKTLVKQGIPIRSARKFAREVNLLEKATAGVDRELASVCPPASSASSPRLNFQPGKCRAATAKGGPCKNNAKPGTQYCGIKSHQP